MRDNGRRILFEDRKNAAISPTPQIFRIGELEIDPSIAAVTRNREPVAIRPKTYRVLLFLLERPGRIVTKEELVGGVWPGTAVSDDVLIRCVAELRRILGDDAKNPQLLRTFPKLGYGLMAPVTRLAAASETAVDVAAPARNGNRFRSWAVAAATICVFAIVMYRQRDIGPDDAPFFEVAWWRLNGNSGTQVVDATGNQRDGETLGSATWTETRQGRAMRFMATGSAARGRDGGSLPAGDSERTVTAWIRMDQPRLDDTTIFTYGSAFRGPTEQRFAIGVTRDGRISVGSPVDGGNVATPRAWTDDGWHQVVATYSPSGPKGDQRHGRASLYVDGQPEVEQELATVPRTTGRAQWSIGQNLGGGTGFRGDIRDVRVYAWAFDPAKAQALYRCAADIRDFGNFYYMRIYYGGLRIARRLPGAMSNEIENNGRDFTGVQLAPSGGDCGLKSLYGANFGQDLRASGDFLVPTDATGHITQAGPYFRSRRAMAGDGLQGGTSAGYWVSLQSDGGITVKCLNPKAVVAFSSPVADFDAMTFHHLETEVRGGTVRVSLDGTGVAFDLGGHLAEDVPVPPLWDKEHIGKNQGAAGVAFGTEDRGMVGGQRARNLRFERLP